MPLIEPGNGRLREKIGLIAPAGAGKTSAALSIAWWAKQADDTRSFYICDTDDEAVMHVLNEDKYDGMVHSMHSWNSDKESFDEEVIEPTGNIHVFSCPAWDQMEGFSRYVMKHAVKGDWIIIDFISHWWPAVQTAFLLDATNRTREEVLYEAGVKGKTGWTMFEDINWNAVNAKYFGATKCIFVENRAHLLVTGEENAIQEGGKMSDQQKEHTAQFGRFSIKGQKALPYQFRSYLRMQRLARGRVLYTLKDRARQEYNGETIAPDFFTFYLAANGWKAE